MEVVSLLTVKLVVILWRVCVYLCTEKTVTGVKHFHR